MSTVNHGHKDNVQRRTAASSSATNKRITSPAKARRESDAMTSTARPVNRRANVSTAAAKKSEDTAPKQPTSRGRSKSATRPPKAGDDASRVDAVSTQNRGVRPSSSAPFARSPDGVTDEKTKLAQQPEEALTEISAVDAFGGTGAVMQTNEHSTVDGNETAVEFEVPDRKEAEQFEAAAFLVELRSLSDCLQSVIRHQQVDDFEADRLNKMTSAVTGTLDNFKAYSNCVQRLLETIREQMKNVADLVFKMVLQPALAERGLDHRGDSQ